MIAIAAVSRNWGIGNNNRLLFRIPEDMSFFREITANGAVIMGRATFEALPGAKPLNGRLNIVLSRRKGYTPAGAVPAGSVREALEAAASYGQDRIFVIGGEDIYHETIAYCRLAYLTKIDDSPPADRFFPNLDEMPEWECADAGIRKNHGGIGYAIATYENKSVKTPN